MPCSSRARVRRELSVLADLVLLDRERAGAHRLVLEFVGTNLLVVRAGGTGQPRDTPVTPISSIWKTIGVLNFTVIVVGEVASNNTRRCS